jgi:parallel beta-helix repeat protein
MKVSTSYSYTTYKEPILNKTCYESLEKDLTKGFTKGHKEIIDKKNNSCYYNYTRNSFTDFAQVTKLDKIYKNSVIGIKLEFKSPIEVEAGEYLKNHFNFTLLSGYNVTLDPSISACTELNQSGATYLLTGHIFDSAISGCMNISANNITLDCQTWWIQGDLAADYGVIIKRSSSTTTNITIKNCVVNNWDTGNIYLEYADGNTIQDTSTNNGREAGIYLVNSANNTITRVTADTTYYYGIHLKSSVNNTITSATIILSDDEGILLEDSSYNTITDSTFRDGDTWDGDLWLDGAENNHIYNNLFNNTIGIWVQGTALLNYLNTTQQSGTRIYSSGNQIGGNYYTTSAGGGQSDTCTDANKDGFCDDAYTIGTDNIDYLALSNEYSPLRWYNNQSSIPSSYSPNTYSRFNMTWNTTSGSGVNISMVFLYTNCSGSEVKYTMTNATYGGDIFNLTLTLPACSNAYWYSKANTTTNIWETSGTWYFTIDKNQSNPVHLVMSSSHWLGNMTDGNVSVKTTDTVYAFAYMDYSDGGTVNIYVDGGTISNPYSNTFGGGTHTVKVNTSGNTNYTSNSTGITFYIISSVPVVSGGGGGGGGGGYPLTQPLVTAHLGEQCSNETACTIGLTCENSICVAKGIEYCGNSVCDYGETFLNCPEDCPSQSAPVAQAQFVIIAVCLGYVLIIRPRAEEKKRKKMLGR